MTATASTPSHDRAADAVAARVEPSSGVSAVPGTTPGTSASWVRRRRHGIAVAALTSVTAAAYFTYLLVYYRSLHYGLLDLGIYDQAVQGYAHFHAPNSPVVALPNATDPGLSQLSDHFTPLLAVIAPLYWIHDSPVTLLFATAVLSALLPQFWKYRA